MTKNQKIELKFNFTWLQVQKRAICAQIELSNSRGIRQPKHWTLGKELIIQFSKHHDYTKNRGGRDARRLLEIKLLRPSLRNGFSPIL